MLLGQLFMNKRYLLLDRNFIMQKNIYCARPEVHLLTLRFPIGLHR